MPDQLAPPKCPTGLKPTANRMKGKGTEPVEPQQGCSSPVPIRLVTKTTEVEKKGKRRSPRTPYVCVGLLISNTQTKPPPILLLVGGGMHLRTAYSFKPRDDVVVCRAQVATPSTKLKSASLRTVDRKEPTMGSRSCSAIGTTLRLGRVSFRAILVRESGRSRTTRSPQMPSRQKPVATRMKGKGTKPVEPQQGSSSPVPVRRVTTCCSVPRPGRDALKQFEERQPANSCPQGTDIIEEHQPANS